MRLTVDTASDDQIYANLDGERLDDLGEDLDEFSGKAVYTLEVPGLPDKLKLVVEFCRAGGADWSFELGRLPVGTRITKEPT